MDYVVAEIRPTDRRGAAEADRLLSQEGLKRDTHLDYVVGLYDGDCNLLATGACFANTLRCLAVDGARQGEGLLNLVMSHLTDYQARRGNVHLFLYTKTDKINFFESLGFHEIARVQNRLVFMENRKEGFSSFLKALAQPRRFAENETNRCAAALVMNCNPFTLGHRYLVEQAAGQNHQVHLFVVSEDVSFFSFADRYRMVEQGCSDLNNVILHQTESYMVSSAVFPAYFLEDEESAIEAQARLDLVMFGKIARALNLSRRYVGEEPFSKVTHVYNEVMARELPLMGLELVVVPRAERSGHPISASLVRQLIHDGQLEAVRPLVPPSTFDYFTAERGRDTLKRIQSSSSVVHH
ncbi:MAG: [citrate (pro-3S)-lyase] ligase [Synergistaceae bacterium]|jgi:[citrate (pro-3S)-lyase] ligase|nr:[citrate (pro-3S)-lyase] ligase [Synergistaceae bacterium]